MRIEQKLTCIVVIVCFIPIFLWLLTFWSPSFSNNYSDWAAFGDFVGGVLSPVLAFVAFIGLLKTLQHERNVAAIQKIVRDDQKYFDHAVTSMERAYNIVSASGKNSDEPVLDRLAWITCARLLLSSKEASNKLSGHSEGLHTLFIGEEDFWRYKFYELFNPIDSRTINRKTSYFPKDVSDIGSELDQRSIRVIYEFFQWAEDKDSPLSSVERYTDEELEDMKRKGSDMAKYILSMRHHHRQLFAQRNQTS